jgi:hypothetical protein
MRGVVCRRRRGSSEDLLWDTVGQLDVSWVKKRASETGNHDNQQGEKANSQLGLRNTQTRVCVTPFAPGTYGSCTTS